MSEEKINQELSDDELKNVAGGYYDITTGRTFQGKDNLVNPADNSDPGTKTPTFLSKNKDKKGEQLAIDSTPPGNF